MLKNCETYLRSLSAILLMLCDIYRMENKDAWQPDQYLEEFDKDTFDVETHATAILKKGNINEEVSSVNIFLNGGITHVREPSKWSNS